MCVVIDLEVVCLVCLQPSKEMHPIFTPDIDNSDLLIAQKICILSELKIDKNNQILPSKICDNCLQDLKAAWRFRKNCQAAVIIFQTIVKLDDAQPENLAAKELAEQQIIVPHGLQIKRIDNSNEAEVATKADESLKHKKATSIEEIVISNAEESVSLQQELSTHEYAERREDVDVEFQTLEQAEESNVDEDDDDDDDENTLVEYYLTDDVLDDEPRTKIENRVTSSLNTTKGQKQARENFVQKPLSRGRPRRSIVIQNQDVDKSKAKTNVSHQSMQKAQHKRKEKTVTAAGNSDEKNDDKPVQVQQVRQVRTRKRKSLSPDSKPPKICEICGNSYRFQHALNAHMRRHYNDKPFPCEFCDKAFVSNVELRRHMRVHTGQKPYACQYCERRFSDFGSRIKHERTHTGERPYHCITCGKSFAYPHVLSVHLRTHTGEKRFRCNFCSKGFTKKAYLLTHIEQHHSESDNFQVIIQDTTDNNSEMEPTKGEEETFEECIFTTEFVNDDGGENEDSDDEDDDHQDGKIVTTPRLLQPKLEDSDNEGIIHEIVEVEPDEYTIQVR